MLPSFVLSLTCCGAITNSPNEARNVYRKRQQLDVREKMNFYVHPATAQVNEKELLNLLVDDIKSYTLPQGDCLVWTGMQSKGGFPISEVMWKPLLHNIAAQIFLGPPPIGKPFARTTCGDRLCLSPNHLRWMSYHENGTALRGISRELQQLFDLYEGNSYLTGRLTEIVETNKFANADMHKSDKDIKAEMEGIYSSWAAKAWVSFCPRS